MLLILSGNTQTGKTRWLQGLVEALARKGISCYGVLSPGVWHKRETMADTGEHAVEYEKLGIETVFLPSMERLPFAQRRDLAEPPDGFSGRQAEWQSVKAELGWVIPDKAIDAVNRHFNAIGASCTDRKTHDASDASRANGLLIVDELGRLELCKGTGFVSATQLLKRGPTSLYSHALVVARTGLAQLAGEQLSPCWEKTIMISPDNDTQKMLTSLMGG